MVNVHFSAAGGQQPGTLRLILPAVVLANRPEVASSSVLPVLTAHLACTVESDPQLTKKWPFLEWVWQDMVLLVLVNKLSRENSKDLRLKVCHRAFMVRLKS